MKIVISMLLLFAAVSAAAQPTPVDYRFDEVTRKVVVTSAQKQMAAVKGLHAQGGDLVSTGWFSHALLSTEHYRARFEIFAATDVKLSEGTPGVILSLERGKLHAMFDKITGSEPRVVKTPGALLAVRGTQYDVEVSDDGNSTLKVWEGTVAVTSELQHEPLLVHAGEAARFGRAIPPASRPMTQAERASGSMGGEGHNRGAQGASGHGEPAGSTPEGHGPNGAMPPGGQPAHPATPPPTNGSGHH